MKALPFLCLTMPGCSYYTGPDMGPVGAGLSVIGLGIVVGALVLTLFRGGGQ
jgi:hypothetical protein